MDFPEALTQCRDLLSNINYDGVIKVNLSERQLGHMLCKNKDSKMALLNWVLNQLGGEQKIEADISAALISMGIMDKGEVSSFLEGRMLKNQQISKWLLMLKLVDIKQKWESNVSESSLKTMLQKCLEEVAVPSNPVLVPQSMWVEFKKSTLIAQKELPDERSVDSLKEEVDSLQQQLHVALEKDRKILLSHDNEVLLKQSLRELNDVLIGYAGQEMQAHTKPKLKLDIEEKILSPVLSGVDSLCQDIKNCEEMGKAFGIER